LFCYEPPLLKDLLELWAASVEPVRLLVTHGRATRAVKAELGSQSQIGNLKISYLPLLTQITYDTLLACCDLNFVRGEDSVLRAIWAGQPFIWHIYPQQDLAHTAKLEAFLDQMQFSTDVRVLHRAWNGLQGAPQHANALKRLQVLPSEEWRNEVHTASQRLFKMNDLTSCLLEFVQKKR
jgi:uncharacterized repeat protein (TIGR03837 family)